MNYEALDEALAYIEYKNSDEVVNEDASLWILAGIFAAMFATIAACVGIGGQKYRKEAKRIDEAMKDPKLQEIFKKLISTMQKDIMKYPKFKNYSKFVKPLPYEYQFVNKVGDPAVDKVVVSFNFLQFDMEAIFKTVMGTDMTSYSYEYNLNQPDNCKPAPKFKKYVKEMIRAVESYVSDNINKRVKKCKGHVEVDEYEAQLDTDLELYYDSWNSDVEGDDFNLNLILVFNKEDFVNKNVE